MGTPHTGTVLSLLMSLVACGTDEPETYIKPTPTWQGVAQGESSALLSIWGSRSDDVWVAGSRTSPTGGPLVLHYDGEAWSRVDTGQTSLDLWWVTGLDNGDALFSGSGGTILREHDGVFQRLTTPAMVGTLFGVWAAAPDDIWAVGDAGTAGGVVWHSTDGQTFEPVAIPGAPVSRVFKVHGQSSNDVWMSCAGGVVLHWDGSQLTREQTPSPYSLFSIVTTPDLVVAVGGTGGDGELLVRDGSGWRNAGLPNTPIAWRGAAARDSEVVVVGEAGLIGFRGESSWGFLQQDLTYRNFHAAWLDENEGLWAVGGVFDGRLADGMLVYHGVQTIAEVTQ